MKKIFVLFSALAIIGRAAAQDDVPDHVRLDTILSQCYRNFYQHPDSILVEASLGKSIAHELDLPGKEARCDNLLAGAYATLGNYPQAMQSYIAAIQGYEKTNELYLLGDQYTSIADLFGQLNNYDSAIAYYHIAEIYLNDNFSPLTLAHVFTGLARSYAHLAKWDSARIFNKYTYEMLGGGKDKQHFGFYYLVNATIHSHNDSTEAAKQDYRRAIALFQESGEVLMECQSWMGLAGLYANGNKSDLDSMVVFAFRALDKSNPLFPHVQLEAASLISAHYKAQGRYDSAFKFLEMSAMIKDRIYNRDSIARLQGYAANEKATRDERNRELKETKERNIENMQVSGIAMFIPAFFTGLIFLSRRKTSPRLISVLSTFAVLMGFEFVLFAIHPFIEQWVNHNQILLFLSLITVAALLSPVHEHLNSWAKSFLCPEHKEHI